MKMVVSCRARQLPGCAGRSQAPARMGRGAGAWYRPRCRRRVARKVAGERPEGDRHEL